MSYNGIGLASVRGSATSGHVQANQGHVRAQRRRRQIERNAQESGGSKRYNPVSASAREKGNQEIQDHERRRQIENQLLVLRDDLEESGNFTEAQIEDRIQAERERQMQKFQQEKEQKKQQHKISLASYNYNQTWLAPNNCF